MKEGIVYAGPRVEIVDSPIPEPQADHVVIKVIYSGSNPKDWKGPEWIGKSINQGDDIAGYIHEVGTGVVDFKVGDRVAAFHEMYTPHGSYAEYAEAPAHTTVHIPQNISFEGKSAHRPGWEHKTNTATTEAATIPLAALTAVIGLYMELNLPPPYRPVASTSIPLVIYGGATAVGSFAIQLARRSNIHPIITVAGRGIPFVEQYLDKSKGDTVIDYRNGDEAVIQGIKNGLKGQKLEHAFDAVAENGSAKNIYPVLDPHGAITFVLPVNESSEVPETTRQTLTKVSRVHEDARDAGLMYFKLIAQGLKEGWLKSHPYEVVPGGISGVQQGLTDLKEGKASAKKFIFRVADTPGV